MLKAQKHVAKALALTCNTFFELNIKRRYFIRLYVNKKFQQLCSASVPIGDQLFPNDAGKRMKEINDASHINRQLPVRYGPKNSRGRPNTRAQAWYQNQRGRGQPSQRRPRGHTEENITIKGK